MTAADGSGAPVSVVMPVDDEEPCAVGAALATVRAQDYAGAVEIVVALGPASPGVREVAARAGARVVANPAGSAAAGLNAAVAAASHAIVARCDARCGLPPGYLRRAVATLARTGAANVGGMQCGRGRTPFERAVARAMGTWLGSGGARYRLGGPEGPVDTVFLGVFRREALDAMGGFDESLARNQDYELNWRLRAAGGTVWFDPALAVAYRPRGSAAALARQYFDYGRWKRAVLRRHPGSVRLRQLAPPALLLALSGASMAVAAAVPLGAWTLAGAAATVPAVYAGVVGAGAVGAARRGCAGVHRLVGAFATMHLAWGAGFLCGPPRPGADGRNGRRRRPRAPSR